MWKIFSYIILVVIAFVVLAWDTDIRPRIFLSSNSKKIKPSFKIGIWIYTACFFAALMLFLLLSTIDFYFEAYQAVLAFFCIFIALFLGNYFTKKCLRECFLESAASLNLSPVEYAKSISPHYVVDYIENHLSDKKALSKYIKEQKIMARITDACAWAFLVAYCRKRP